MANRDPEIREDVQAELSWEPGVSQQAINVEVTDGFVTLTGTVDSYAKKIFAELAAGRVHGVNSVLNNIRVTLAKHLERTDLEIAEAVKQALRWSSTVPEQNITVDVKEGWVTLTGHVQWDYQKRRAKRIAEDIIGVQGVNNSITIDLANPTTNDVKEKIGAALKRHLDFDDNQLHVDVQGHTVMLTGKVHSISEKNRAERAAWSAPGVNKVENNLQVGLTKPFF